MKFLVSGSVAVLALATTAAAGTITVGPPGSGAMFTEIQPAIDAALPGDLIQVSLGNYREFDLNKPVRVIGAGAGLTVVSNTTVFGNDWKAARVTGIAAGESALVADMTFVGVSGGGDPPGSHVAGASFLVDQCAGSVELHGLEVEHLGPFGTGSLEVRDSNWVVVNDCTVTGQETVGEPCVGAWFSRSEVWVSGSRVQGGSGDVIDDPLFSGGAIHSLIGMYVEDASVYVARTEIAGGDGVIELLGSVMFLPSPAGDGGDGLRASGSSVVTIAGGGGSSILGGDRGFLQYFWQGLPGLDFGEPGAAIAIEDQSLVFTQQHVTLESGLEGHPPVQTSGAGVHVPLVDVFPSLDVSPSSLAPAAPGTLELQGNPDGTFALLLAPALLDTPLHVPGVAGNLALDPFGLLVGGTFVLSGAGEYVLPFNAPSSPGAAGKSIWFQGLEFFAGTSALSNPALLLIRP